jgi:hypothetical protein
MGILYHFIYLDDIGTDPNQYFDSSKLYLSDSRCQTKKTWAEKHVQITNQIKAT